MLKLKTLSGEEVIQVFISFGFEITAQRGSHVKLRRLTPTGKQTLTVPNHKELDKGTLRAIYVQGLRYIPESDLRQHFYTD
ncbi:MAG: type II toxin-antitoxin system HicA family toxin [Patescibacteria group bacterium]